MVDDSSLRGDAHRQSGRKGDGRRVPVASAKGQVKFVLNWKEL